jgi:hypothetical protein
MSPRYARTDFNQSSNHLYITKTDLHLYDDGSITDFPKDWNIDNGAIQLVLSRVSVDVYPSHAPLWKQTGKVQRKDWVNYDSANFCASETEKLIAMHLSNINESLSKSRCSKNMLICLDEGDRKQFSYTCQQLRSQNIVLRINDILLYRVSQQSSKKDSLLPLIQPDNSARQTLPQHPIVHLELANYYYLNPSSFPGILVEREVYLKF